MSVSFNKTKTLISDTPAWQALREHVDVIEGTHLRVRRPLRAGCACAPRAERYPDAGHTLCVCCAR